MAATMVTAAAMTAAVAATMTTAVAAASAFRQRCARQHDGQRDRGNSNGPSLHRTLPRKLHHRGIGI
jgi:cytochrome c2